MKFIVSFLIEFVSNIYKTLIFIIPHFKTITVAVKEIDKKLLVVYDYKNIDNVPKNVQSEIDGYIDINIFSFLFIDINYNHSNNIRLEP